MKTKKLKFKWTKRMTGKANTPFGEYAVFGNCICWRIKFNGKLLPIEGEYDNKFYSPDKAISAAQEDFENRIKQCLDVEES